MDDEEESINQGDKTLIIMISSGWKYRILLTKHWSTTIKRYSIL